MNVQAEVDGVPHRLIMHFTHVRNLPGILAAGYIRADSFVDRSSALRVEAGDLNVKALRKQRRVPLAPFGRVADYVPFYFAPRSPMLYTLAKGNQDRLRRRMAEFSDLPGVTVLLYPPQDSPPPRQCQFTRNVRV